MLPDSPLELLDKITPAQCRAIARHLDSRGRPMTLKEISDRSGLPVRRVSWISRQQTFANVTVMEASLYLMGCWISLRNQRKHLRYIRRTAQAGWPMAHLVKLPWKQRKAIMDSLQ